MWQELITTAGEKRKKVENNLFLMSFDKAFISLADPILVKRDNQNSRIVSMLEIKKRALTEKVAIFPEGTCTNREMILKFRLGAFTPALPVQAVYLQFEPRTG